MTEEEMEFCMIPMKSKEEGKFDIFPLPQKHCHCRNTKEKHFSMYGKFNKERTSMIPSSEIDVEAFTKYCENLNTTTQT